MSINKVYSFFLIASIFIITCCQSNKEASEETSTKTTVVADTIKQINFYFENSGSINGYLKGDKFVTNIYRVLSNSEAFNLKSYFVNSSTYPEPDLRKRISNKDIETEGTESSDHKHIFKEAIKNATDNNLSLVVTDGIYAVEGSNLNLVAIDIENTFKSSLEVNKIETLVLQFSSNFTGKYYSGTCTEMPVQKINNVERPYYIILFGKKELLDQAVKDVIKYQSTDYKGFKNSARFFINESDKISYTILTTGEQKIGRFEGKGYAFIYNTVELDQKEVLPDGERGVQFAVAIDYSSIGLPDTYLKDTSNYSINKESGFKIKRIINIDSLKSNSETIHELEDIKNIDGKRFTHLLVISAKSDLFVPVEIKLVNKLPAWIAETGTDNDCNIALRPGKTVTFDKMINGISRAYFDANGRDYYIKIELKIEA